MKEPRRLSSGLFFSEKGWIRPISLEIPRKQGLQLFRSVGDNDVFQNMAQILLGVDVVSLGAFDERIKECACIRSSGRAGEEPVLSSHGKRSDCVLRLVIVRKRFISPIFSKDSVMI